MVRPMAYLEPQNFHCIHKHQQSKTMPNKEEPEDTDETEDIDAENEEKKCKRKRPGERDIILTWDDPPMPFPEYEQVALDDIVYPVQMIPNNLGQRIIYNKDDQQTFFAHLPPVWWFYPNTKYHLYGEEFRPDMGAMKYFIAFVYNQTENGWYNPINIENPIWLINDIYDPDANPSSRAYNTVNLGPQPEGVVIAKIFQVADEDNVKRYMDQFVAAGCRAAIVRSLDHVNDEPQQLYIPV